eukprot:TRINITY_DN7374_c0_g1_i3.p1 TRINITY_DN7374_c0_g1~~TRINITY_DN7374_c0_g1_i3.p1  ORF type:complete len:207 (-),score=45.96 TRINITY_DN7374_c0_g1_i3:6-626(-)
MHPSLVVVYVALSLVFVPLSTAAPNPGCCAPSQWSINATELNNFGSVTHTIYYDAVNQLVRWNRVGNLEGAAITSLDLYTIYPKGIEYLYTPGPNASCVPYGPDAFNKWCYGSMDADGEKFVSNITAAGQACTLWSNTIGMQWVSTQKECMPFMFRSAGSSFLYYDAAMGVDPNVFVPPAICHTSSTKIARSPSPFAALKNKLFPQ